MEGKLHLVRLTQAEMYDLGNIKDITHHILYDSGTRVAVDITAEVSQAPLLSAVQPYQVVSEQSVAVLARYLAGNGKIVKNWKKAGGIPCVTGFEAQELVGDQYIPVRESMVALRDARKTLDDKVGEMRNHSLQVELVKPQQKE